MTQRTLITQGVPVPPAQYLRRAARASVQGLVELSPFRAGLFWRLPAGAEGVALTFDDGPDPDGTPAVLEILSRYGAQATFFLVGRQVREHTELARRIAREGHALGSHTGSHARCNSLTPPELLREVEDGEAAIRDAVGSAPRLLRPPFGAVRPEQAWRLVRSGRRLALWSRDSRDYDGASPGAIAGMGETLRRRDILLLHDRFPSTIQALPQLLEALRRRGIPTLSLEDRSGRA
jgi:peptidoglycan/xylan/chitin deacetylase (PgdA/CDA1 family)